MPRRRAQVAVCAAPVVIAVGLWLLSPASALGSGFDVSDDAAIDDRSRPLQERQAALRARVSRLENRMVELARILAETEPAKAERLRDTLDLAGELRVREQLEAIVELLNAGKTSEAGAAQEALLE
ncbi:MAG: hypothetical protein D6744_10200, partial [Planctomycetota bacterium]